jgi:hypothetical protein
VAGRQVVDDDDFVVGIEKGSYEVATDVARSAGDENSHEREVRLLGKLEMTGARRAAF